MFKHIQGVHIFRQESELYNSELADESLDDSYESYDMTHIRMHRMNWHMTIWHMMMGHRVNMTHMAHMWRGSVEIWIDIRFQRLL